MDSLGGLTDFFYNLVPGTLFVFALDELGIKLINLSSKEPSERIFWVLILGFFFGFLGQGIARVLKKCLHVNEFIMKGVVEKPNSNNKKMYQSCLKKFKKSAKRINEKYIVDNFYAMDNFLRNSRSPYVINHFAQRAAFWANICLGSLIITSISLFKICVNPSMIIFSLFLSILSGWFSYDCSRTEYESVLQTFALEKY